MSQDYVGQHTAPGPDFGAPMHDVTANGMYPKDFYEKSHHYVSGAETGAHESMRAVRAVKGKRHAFVTVYRAIPHGLKGAKINEGDWVTPSREYAKEHGRSNLNSKYRVISKKVKAGHLFNNADSINEWGFHPSAHIEPRTPEEHAERQAAFASANAQIAARRAHFDEGAGRT
jgi:nitroreductase